MNLYRTICMNKRILLIISFLIYVSLSQAEAQSYDVVVYGATAGGVTASVAASNNGARVLLVEPGKNVGGMVTGGLSHTIMETGQLSAA